jgi:hypothetical protein
MARLRSTQATGCSPTLGTGAVKDAYAIKQDGFTTPGKALTAWWPDRQWMNMNPTLQAKAGEAWSFETSDAVYTYERAVTPFFWANYLPPKLGSEQLYLMGMRDKDGVPLSGKRNYVARVPADVPVDKFWSVIVYSQKTNRSFPTRSIKWDWMKNRSLKLTQTVQSISISVMRLPRAKRRIGCHQQARTSSSSCDTTVPRSRCTKKPGRCRTSSGLPEF